MLSTLITHFKRALSYSLSTVLAVGTRIKHNSDEYFKVLNFAHSSYSY